VERRLYDADFTVFVSDITPCCGAKDTARMFISLQDIVRGGGEIIGRPILQISIRSGHPPLLFRPDQVDRSDFSLGQSLPVPYEVRNT